MLTLALPPGTPEPPERVTEGWAAALPPAATAIESRIIFLKNWPHKGCLELAIFITSRLV